MEIGDGLMLAESTFIKEGVWNRIRIDADVIRNAAPSILGRYLMLNHPDERSCPAWNDTALAQVIGYELVEPGAALRVTLKVQENRLPSNVMEQLQEGKNLPVSSGHLAFHKPENGVLMGVPYDQIATKIYFEHIALVPIGACSLEDGCSLSLCAQEPEKATIRDIQIPRSIPINSRKSDLSWPAAKARIRRELGIRYI